MTKEDGVGTVPKNGRRGRWKSKIHGAPTLTVTHQGVYGDKCVPHLKTGIAGVIVVDDPSVCPDHAKKIRLACRANQPF